MKKRVKITGLALFIIGLTGLAVAYLQGKTVAVFQPAGTIAQQQRTLIIAILLLSLLVVVPVFAMTIWISWRYRESNKKAAYAPDWDNNRWVEGVWWLVPLVLISIISVITWRTSHSLDPFRPLVSTVKPLEVQVVAMNWKWLFIYPEYGVATVNYLFIPTETPINFEITSDASMNSFWIPQLGGQVYAMAGMSTRLHLMADKTGDFRGSSANLSGKGFAGMNFMTYAVPGSEFSTWSQLAKSSPEALTETAYQKLAKPSQNVKPLTYTDVDSELYDSIVMKYMMPARAGLGELGSTHETDPEGH